MVESQFESRDLVASLPRELSALFEECGGRCYGRGLYKIHSLGSSLHWSMLIGKYFPGYARRILPFGFDWMGRQFCIDKTNEKIIFMFDPATAEDFEVHTTLAEFHNSDLVRDRDNTVAERLFHEALKYLGLLKIQYQECLGYKIPLFLSGEDKVTNYEVIDVEVSWEFQLQIYAQTRDLKPGTKIGDVIFRKRE